MSNKVVAAKDAVNAFLDLLKDTVAEDPQFRARMVDVLGLTVVYEGEEQFQGANPVKQAAQWSEDAFARIWSGAKVTDLKQVLKERSLATATDMRGLKKSDLISLLYRRALEQAENTGLI